MADSSDPEFNCTYSFKLSRGLQPLHVRIYDGAYGRKRLIGEVTFERGALAESVRAAASASASAAASVGEEEGGGGGTRMGGGVQGDLGGGGGEGTGGDDVLWRPTADASLLNPRAIFAHIPATVNPQPVNLHRALGSANLSHKLECELLLLSTAS